MVPTAARLLLELVLPVLAAVFVLLFAAASAETAAAAVNLAPKRGADKLAQ
jgi:TRAP-type C4-dicarboxylate transport system permease small subunit